MIMYIIKNSRHVYVEMITLNKNGLGHFMTRIDDNKRVNVKGSLMSFFACSYFFFALRLDLTATGIILAGCQ